MRVLRRIGLGDLEHVRNGLLSVAYFGTARPVEVAEAAFKLGDQLQMMTRLHLDFNRLTESQKAEVMNIFFRNQAHQLEPWQKDVEFLKTILQGCELIVQDTTSMPLVLEHEDDVYGLDLRGAWSGRPLHGNHARLSRQELKQYGHFFAEFV